MLMHKLRGEQRESLILAPLGTGPFGQDSGGVAISRATESNFQAPIEKFYNGKDILKTKTNKSLSKHEAGKENLAINFTSTRMVFTLMVKFGIFHLCFRSCRSFQIHNFDLEAL